MFGLFKKQKKMNVIVIDDTSLKVNTIDLVKKVTNSNNYPKEVLEIHHEFNTAADNLIIEANKVLNEAKSKDCEKVSRLESLGFKQANQVIELKPLMNQARLSTKQLESLAYYQQNYPNNKFITEEQVKIICHKYNLVCGEVGRFKGFVPEKNLKQIESFKLKEADEGILLSNGMFLEGAYIGSSSGGYKHIFKKGVSGKYAFQASPSEPNRFYASDNYNLFGMEYLGSVSLNVASNSFQICAPIKDMDIQGLELENGYKLVKKHIPDPVVLQPVKNGYLIVTAWGDEASDELVINQKMN